MVAASQAPVSMGNPFDKTVLMSVTIRMLGVSRKVSVDSVQVDTDKALLSVSKKIIDCEEYKQVSYAALGIKSFLRQRSVPGVRFIKAGIYPIPVASVEDVDTKMQELISKYNSAVAKFVEVYEARSDEAMARLNVLGSRQDYPTVEAVRKAFGVSTEYVSIGPPSALKSISVDIWNRESERIRESCQEAATQVRDAMRSMFQELVDHMVDRLTPAPDGKRKIFKASLVGNFKEFIDGFADRNITNDADLEKLVEQAREVLAGKSVESLRENGDIRQTIVQRMTAVKSSLDAMMQDKPSRAIAFDDEPAPDESATPLPV